jgi:hypothetical protein
MLEQRRRKRSREKILKKLKSLPTGHWTFCRDALVNGSFSEDLQDLVREGLVQSDVPVRDMHATSEVRLRR